MIVLFTLTADTGSGTALWSTIYVPANVNTLAQATYRHSYHKTPWHTVHTHMYAL